MKCDACLDEKELLPSKCIHHVCAECNEVLQGDSPCPVSSVCAGKPIIHVGESYEAAIARHKKKLDMEPPELTIPDDDDVQEQARIILKLAMGWDEEEDASVKFVCRKDGEVHRVIEDGNGISYQIAGAAVNSFVTDLPIKRIIALGAQACITVVDSSLEIHITPTSIRVTKQREHLIDRCTDFDTGITVYANHVVCETDEARALLESAIKEAREEIEQEDLQRYEAKLEAQGAKRKRAEANIEVLEMHAEYEAKGLSHLLRPLERDAYVPLKSALPLTRPSNVYTLSPTAKVALVDKRLFLDATVLRVFTVSDNVQWTVNGDVFSVLTVSGWTALRMSTGEPCEPQPRQYLCGCLIPSGRVECRGRAVYVGGFRFK